MNRAAPRGGAAARGGGAAGASDTPLDDKIALMSNAATYGLPAGAVERRETHMSWVFLAGEEAYKLKKPVRLPYLDFSTLPRREAACRAELALNRRLAPDVYKGVVPLTRSRGGLAIGGPGETVDWLVVMRRLDPSGTLAHAIAAHRLTARQLDGLLSTLQAFYAQAAPALIPAEAHLRNWWRRVTLNTRVLLDGRLRLPAGPVRTIGRMQRLFLARRPALLARRVHGRRIVDGHGDLRPEHIFLGNPVRIIDGLEFNSTLRAVDPLDEIALLCLECERLGGGVAAARIGARGPYLLAPGAPEELFIFYRCYRASLRARLAAAHFLDPTPQTAERQKTERQKPERWQGPARAYLRLAAADARRLRRFLGP